MVLHDQVARGPTSELQRALTRTPPSLRLCTLYALCKRIWYKNDARVNSAWDRFAEPMARELQVLYAGPLPICNQAQVEILLVFAVRWPCTENLAALWVSHLADHWHHIKVDQSEYNLASSALYLSRLHLRARSLGQAGKFSEAKSLFRRLLDMYDTISLHFDIEQQSCLDVYSNLATYIKELGQRLLYEDQWEEALPLLEQAATMYRNLVLAIADSFNEGLAETLCDLSLCFSELKKHNHALSACVEAVRIFEGLVHKQAYSERLNSGLARSSSRLSLQLSYSGRIKEAMLFCGRSVRLYRQLVRIGPKEFSGRLARSLHNLCILGQLREARPLLLVATASHREDTIDQIDGMAMLKVLLQESDESSSPSLDLATIKNELAKLLAQLDSPQLTEDFATNREALMEELELHPWSQENEQSERSCVSLSLPLLRYL